MPGINVRSPIVRESWADKATAIFGTPKEACIALIADASSAAFGFCMGSLGAKTVIFTTYCTATGAATGALEGIERAVFNAPLKNFAKKTAASFPFLLIGPALRYELQYLAAGAGIFFAMRGLVGAASQTQEKGDRINEKELRGKLVERAIEWWAGAAAGTAAAGALSGVAGVALSIGGGVIAGKTARAAARALCSTLFG